MTLKLRGSRVIKITRLPKDKDQAVDQTARCMVAITLSEAWSPDVFRLASNVALPGTGLGEIPSRFSRFVKARMKFELDPEDIELIRLPSAYARDLFARRVVRGDCDDMALLLGTLLSNRGFAVQYVVMGTSPHDPEFRHIFTRAYLGGGKWIGLDPSVTRSYDTTGLRTRIYPVVGTIPPMR